MMIFEGFTNCLRSEVLETNEIEKNIFTALEILLKSV